jgi:hypothetical protein
MIRLTTALLTLGVSTATTTTAIAQGQTSAFTVDRACSRGLIETNITANGEIIKKMDRALMHSPTETNTSAK